MPQTQPAAIKKISGSSKSLNPNDPRMPEAARKYVPVILKPEELPFDYSSMCSIVAGLFGVMLRQKAGSWISLIFAAQALALMRNPEQDLKHIVCAVTFAAMGIITNYFGPQSQR